MGHMGISLWVWAKSMFYLLMGGLYVHKRFWGLGFGFFWQDAGLKV